MVVGIDRFREHFADHQTQYALIGGVACDLIFGEAGLEFRATKDFDVVLCVEVVNAEFATAFRDFLEAGGYQAREQSDGHREFYRFHEPADDSYPHVIELFSRQPAALKLPAEMDIAKVAVDEDLLSLSAILLDDEYYTAMQGSKTVIDGVSIIDQTLLIPFKANAYLDLIRRRADGDKVDSKHIKKHRNDVFRLSQLLASEEHVELSDGIAGDLRNFLDEVRNDESLDPKSFGVDLARDEGIALLEAVYHL